jgi:putative glutamine amidotransferase
MNESFPRHLSGGSAPPAPLLDTPRDRPLRIGLSARIMHKVPRELGFRGKTLQYLEQSVAHWIMRQGALVFMVPTLDAEAGLARTRVSVSAYVRELDALVLQGGADVSPQSYGEDALHPDWSGDRVRDLYEIDLFWEFVIQQKPVLGICRGAQLINVAMGGTLYQDIGTQVEEAMRHVDLDAYDEHHHEVAIVPGTRLAQLYPGVSLAWVNSIHHQSVKTLGSGLVVEARAPGDNVIEAIRWTGGSYVLGLQWHPEFHRGEGHRMLDGAPILLEFLRAARERRAQPAPAR